MPDPAALLAAYDAQLRGEAETAGAVSVDRHGPLLLATFPGRGFVTYRDLGGAGAEAMPQLVVDVLDHFRADPAIGGVEWKTRGHDRAPGLHEALLRHGFVPDDTESIMLGEAALLTGDVALAAGVRLRRVSEEADVRAMSAMQDEAFGAGPSGHPAGEVLRRLAQDDGMELWVAEDEGRVVGAGRLEPVAGTVFAGIWGGAVLREWRGKGIYRALTAARARSALAVGKTLVHSDSTEHSRPILQRSGLTRVSTTTPYQWRR